MRTEEREFFKKIKSAITANPFSRDRLSVDLEITGMAPSTPTEEILASLVYRVEKIIERTAEGRAAGRLVDDEDQQLFNFGVLFRLFHKYCDGFDTHIREQIERGDQPCKVEFADSFFNELAGYGFDDVQAQRYFSLFFQMRRAYFFISRIAGDSQCVRDLRKRLWNNIFTCDIELYERFLWNRLEDFSTMLLGETGTGKGLAASAIGRSAYIPFNRGKNSFAESFSRNFISINLSQFPEQLIESELFGHKKGAFTGAVDSHAGVFSRCSPHGAIFLDEIGDVSVPVQIKLLQVLQERSFTPVGSRTGERFKGRVIAATNKSLDKLRQDEDMRDDFYYRLCSDVIHVPSLRQRLAENSGEIDMLLVHIVGRILGHESEELVEKVAAHIKENQPQAYHWPGNIRELEQCVRRILISNSYEWQRASAGGDKLEELFAGANLNAQQLLSRYCQVLYRQHQTYEAVGRLTGLDRRTVKKYIDFEE